jgi:hypothetical protein
VHQRMIGLSREHGTRLRAAEDSEDLLVEGLRDCF